MQLPNPPDFQSSAAVIIGGGAGTFCRFLAGYYFPSIFGASFPWATLFVNVAGSIWLGVFGTLVLAKPGSVDPNMRLLLTTGFAGGFTTFSTLTFESLVLFQRGDINVAAANVSANLLLGFVGVFIGAMVARSL